MGMNISKIDLHGEPSSREKVIFGIVVLLVVFAFFRSCWSPSIKAIKLSKQELTTVLTEKATVEAALAEADRKVKETLPADAKAPPKLDEWAKQVSAAPDVFIMSEFTSPLLVKDIDVKAVDFLETKRDGGIVQQPFHLLVNGSFVATSDYLKRIYDLPMLLVVDSVNLKLDNNAKGRVDTDIIGTVYGW